MCRKNPSPRGGPHGGEAGSAVCGVFGGDELFRVGVGRHRFERLIEGRGCCIGRGRLCGRLICLDQGLQLLPGPPAGILDVRLALPGGPASLRADPGLPDDSKGTLDQLSFLVGVHEVQQVILIAHEPCAFYRERLGVPDVDQHDRQVEDLHLIPDWCPLAGKMIEATPKSFAASTLN